jgi:hypothetical protein
MDTANNPTQKNLFARGFSSLVITEMIGDIQAAIDSSVQYIEDLLGSQSVVAKAGASTKCESWEFMKHIIDVTWIQQPQNIYNLIAIAVSLVIIFVGVNAAAQQLNETKAQKVAAATEPASSAAVRRTSPRHRASSPVKGASSPVKASAVQIKAPEPVVAAPKAASKKRAVSKKRPAARSTSAKVRGRKAKN